MAYGRRVPSQALADRVRIRSRLTLARRRWCLRHNHPMADWSPTVMSETGDDGVTYSTRAWRCERHDVAPC